MCFICVRDKETMSSEIVPEQVVKPNSLIERMKRKHRLSTNPEDEDKLKEVAYQPDLLAVSTQWTKMAFHAVTSLQKKYQDTKLYIILTKTSQPLFLAMALAVLSLWVGSPSSSSIRLWKLLYVGSVAIHLGIVVWMSFVSGLVLYFTLPRHEFGRVQTVLFPFYFAFNAGLSGLALLSYSRIQFITQSNNISWEQVTLLSTILAIEALVRVKLVHPMLRAKHIKTQMEAAAGGGQEVGKLVLGELAHCPRYMSVLKTFRTYHSFIAMGTLISFVCSLFSISIIVDSMCC